VKRVKNSKNKVVPVLNYSRTTIGRRMGSGGVDPPLLTSALDGGEWSDSRPGLFTLGGKNLGTYWIGAGWPPEALCAL
jgi:hypothetical protein